MSQNSIRSRLRRAAWQITPAPILHLVFGARLRGMGRLIDAAGASGFLIHFLQRHEVRT